MGRTVEGGVKVKGIKALGIPSIKINISGKLYPKRKVSFTEELKRLLRHYNLKIKASGGPKGGSGRKKRKKK